MSDLSNLSDDELDELEAKLEAAKQEVPNVSNLGGAGGRVWTGELPPQPERRPEGFTGYAPEHKTVKLQATPETDEDGRPLTFSERFAAMWANQQ